MFTPSTPKLNLYLMPGGGGRLHFFVRAIKSKEIKIAV